MQVRNPTTAYKSTCYDEEFPVKPTAVMITWSYGGRKVAVTGSWDGWQTMYAILFSNTFKWNSFGYVYLYL